MLSKTKPAEFVQQVHAASLEALNLQDFGEHIMPLLENHFDASGSILYQCGADSMTAISGSLIELYNEVGGYDKSIDPLQAEESRLNLSISILSRLSVWKSYLQSEPFHELMHPREADYLLHIRLTDTDYHAPGMVGLVLSRSFRQPDFGKTEESILEKILAPLSAVAKRSRRLEERIGIAEAILGEARPDQIALGLDGRLLWASRGAEQRLDLRRDRKNGLPDPLVAAARRLGELCRGHGGIKHSISEVMLALPDGGATRVELRIARKSNGERFVLAQLETDGILPETLERLRPFGLTPTEVKVLGLLAQGLSDGEIGRRLFVSHATIRTHVGRILGKLGVASRVQAALLTHGFSHRMDSSPH